MKKGDLVRLRPDDPEIARILEWKLGGKDYLGRRPTSEAEKKSWREDKRREIKEAHENGEDTFSIAFDSGGEPRLPPRSVVIPLPVDGIYVVERARCRVQLGYGNPTGGMAKILNTQTGESAYVAREILEVISG